MLLVVSNVGSDTHHPHPRHPERPERTVAALEGIAGAGLGDRVRPIEPRPATVAELTLVHEGDYLRALEALCAGGGGVIDPDTMASLGTWATALLSAGAGLAAIEALGRGEGEAAFTVTRPPGHHARRAQAMGFCFLNNIAVAAATLIGRGERVLVLDWDVHHGNGTQEMFYDDPNLLYVSFHQHPHYPGTGSAEEVGGPAAHGLNLNVPLPPGTTGDVLRFAVDELVAPAAEAFAPTWVLVSCGFDGHRHDPLADWSLTAGDYADLTGVARSFARGAGRLVVFLEGGYDLEAIALSAGATASALVGGTFRPEAPSSGGEGRDHVERAASVRRRALDV